MKTFLRNWSPVLVYASAIFVFSSFQVAVAPGTDKVLHALEYAVMGFFTTRGVLLTWDLPRLQGGVLGALLAALLGFFDELHQYFVPGRDASGGDLAADLVGAVLGAALFLVAASLLYQSHRLYPGSHDKCC